MVRQVRLLGNILELLTMECIVRIQEDPCFNVIMIHDIDHGMSLQQPVRKMS